MAFNLCTEYRVFHLFFKAQIGVATKYLQDSIRSPFSATSYVRTIHPSIHPPTHPPIPPLQFIHPSVYPSIPLPTRPSTGPHIHPSTHPPNTQPTTIFSHRCKKQFYVFYYFYKICGLSIFYIF